MINASIIVGLIALVGAVGLHFANLRQSSLERKRKACAEALTDALKWLEVPYRVRRRPENRELSSTTLIAHIHDLQERLLFHESWLRIEIPALETEYVELVSAVKCAARNAIQDSWETSPVADAQMNIGELGVSPVDAEVVRFSDKVREELNWWNY